MPLIRFSINNPLLTNLMLGIVIVLGVLSWRSMPEEMFPTIELDAVSIRVEFEGASPEEVERQVTLPIEQELDGPCPLVIDGACGLHRGLTHLSAQGVANARSRGLLDDLLMATLDRALPLEQVVEAAVAVREHLDLDVTRFLEELLDVDPIVSEAGPGLGALPHRPLRRRLR